MITKNKIKNIGAMMIMLFVVSSVHAAVFEHPRSVSVLPTKYFDIMFPKQCTYTAQLIAEHGDELFDQVCRELKVEKRFRMPVVISPDSAVLSVSYTASPYNRIVIYDVLPGSDSAYYGDTVLIQFKREVVRAVSLSIRSPFWQFLSTFLSADILQPAYLLNLPFSFVEGACLTVGYEDGASLLDDRASLQLLSQAKLEGCFPTWLQAAGSRDIYPGKKLSQAAGSAFAAYIQQRWGMDRYVVFWHESGSLHLFKLTAGIFKKVYKVSLSSAWKDFESAVPLPADMADMDTFGKCSTVVFPHDQNSLEQYLVSGPYGTIWYDAARHEVDLLTPDKKKLTLFVATDVVRLTLSEDGQYLAVSFSAEGSRTQFKKQRVMVYNVLGRNFLHQKYQMRDGCVMKLADGKLAVAGIDTEGQCAKLCIYALDDDEKEIYSRAFPQNIIPYAPVSLYTGTIACLGVCGNEHFLFTISVADGTERSWNLPYMVLSLQAGVRSLLFSYVPDEPGSLMRMGIIQTDESSVPVSVSVQTSDISGGIHDPVLTGSTLVYSAHKANFFEICMIPLADIPFETSDLVENDVPLPVFQSGSIPAVEKRKFATIDGTVKKENFLNDYQLKEYNPLPYMFRGIWVPMLPLYSFSFDGYQLAPGVGVTYLTQSDPIDSTEGVLSFSTAFADPEDNYQTFNEGCSLSAYIMNSSLPVDISAGGTWRFTTEGSYTLQVLGGAKWQIPLGMSYQDLSFTAQELWTCSTTYFDSETKVTTVLSGWPSVQEAFNDNCFSLEALYSNYHQAGISAYEQCGFETGSTLVLDYDGEKTSGNSSRMADPTTISFVINLGLKMPRLIPIPDINHFIFSLPLTFHSQWYGESGTSCDSYAEVLLAGWESQFGIPVLNLYLTRIGLKLGYEMLLNYDTMELPEPDIRSIGNFLSVLQSSSLNDYVYLTTDGVLSPVVGAMTSMQVTAGLQYRYYFRSNTFRLAAVVKVKM
jgi:hypothetical protein